MKIYIAILLSILPLTEANARCVPVPSRSAKVTLNGIYAPLYDAGGVAVAGCILRADKKVLGFTREAALCNARSGSSMNVKLFHGCCDSGPDSGEIACVVRTQSSGGSNPVHGNGVVVSTNVP